MIEWKNEHINIKFWLWAIILSCFSRPIHEFGHWVVYKFYGIQVHYTFNQVVPYSLEDIKVLGEAGGPLLNVILAIIGYIIFIKSEKLKEFGLALSITNILTRLLAYIPISIFGAWDSNDEGVIGLLTSTNILMYYAFFGIIFMWILILILLKLKLIYKKRFATLILIILVFGAGTGIAEFFQEKYFKDYPINFYEVAKLINDK